jgi:CBS domain-containing protein
MIASPNNIRPQSGWRGTGCTVSNLGAAPVASMVGSAVAGRSPWSLGGQSPLRVGDLMAPAVVVRRGTPLREVARRMLEHQVEGVAVVDAAGRLRGLITERDFLLRERCISLQKVPRLFNRWISLVRGVEAVYAEAGDVQAREVMWVRVLTATEDEPVSAAVERMMHQGAECAVVVRNRVPVGLMSRHDLLRLVARPAPTGPAGEPAPAGKDPARAANWLARCGWRWLCLLFLR